MTLTAWRYTVDGDIDVVRYGVSAINTLGLQSERFLYDGLRRVSGYTDKRGVAWQLGHSSRDLLSLALRSNTGLTAQEALQTEGWPLHLVQPVEAVPLNHSQDANDETRKANVAR